jgi:hypothetical protein
MYQKDIFDRFQTFLNKNDGDFHILEHQVPLETQMEYFKNSNRLRSFLVSLRQVSGMTTDNTDYLQFAGDLHNPEKSKEDKKQILSALAVSKQIKAYRILEKYLQSPDKDLTDWAYMALMESRMVLESELSDEKTVYISTGLGGKGKKLRYYILLLPASGNPFLAYQHQIFESEFQYVLAQEEGEIEQLTIKDNYIEILVLIPFQADIKKILTHTIYECNQFGNFISDYVTVTNVKKLSEKEIAKIIKVNETKSIRTSAQI